MTISISNNVLHVVLEEGDVIEVTHKVPVSVSAVPASTGTDADSDGDTDFTGDRPNDR